MPFGNVAESRLCWLSCVKRLNLLRWIQVLLELQRDWTRHETYDGARAIVEAHGGGYGIGLAYARDMIKPA
jgi:hypothetical protein